MVDIGIFVAAINLIAALYILSLVLRVANELQGTRLFPGAILLSLTGLMFVVHAGVELLGFGETLYALTGLFTTLCLGGAVAYQIRSVLAT